MTGKSKIASQNLFHSGFKIWENQIGVVDPVERTAFNIAVEIDGLIGTVGEARAFAPDGRDFRVHAYWQHISP